jgi:hypothetical protein
MKYLSIISILCGSITLIGTSCKKQITDEGLEKRINFRKVQFVLYTDKDFSTDNHTITFKVSIKKSTNQILWDSTLAPMKIKDIPNAAHKLIIEKAIPGNDPSLLKVGFYYSINDVGNSWYLNAFNVGETFKVVDFDFQ